MTTDGVVLPASHDHTIVALSIIISFLVHTRRCIWQSELAMRAASHGPRGSIGAATVDGIGTWSMHYTAKLALRLPAACFCRYEVFVSSERGAVAGSTPHRLRRSRLEPLTDRATIRVERKLLHRFGSR